VTASRRESAVTHAILGITAIIAVIPFASIIVTSLGSDGAGPGLANYAAAWTQGRFATALASSAIVAVSVVVVTAAVACLAGYALAHMRVPGARFVLGLLLVGLVLPYEVTVLPLYQMLAGWGLVDTYWALILPQVGLSVPLGVFWMRSFFASVPDELLDAARLDGASRLRILVSVLVPIAWPAIATLATIVFLFTWNEFLLALMFTQTIASQTVPIVVASFASDFTISFSFINAAGVIAVIPPVILALAFERYIVSGLTAGAVKG